MNLTRNQLLIMRENAKIANNDLSCALDYIEDLLLEIEELDRHLNVFCKCPSHGPSAVHFNGCS